MNGKSQKITNLSKITNMTTLKRPLYGKMKTHIDLYNVGKWEDILQMIHNSRMSKRLKILTLWIYSRKTTITKEQEQFITDYIVNSAKR